MKKVISLILLFICSLFLVSCKKESIKNEEIDLNTAISYSQLRIIANNQDYIPVNNVVVSGVEFEKKQIKNVVNCLDSHLEIVYNSSKKKYLLYNYKKQVHIDYIDENNVIQTSSLTMNNNVYYDTSYPFIIYSNNQTMIIRNSYGSKVYELPISSYVNIDISNRKIVNGNIYVTISYYLSTSYSNSYLYIKCIKSDNVYNVSTITQEEYQQANSSGSTHSNLEYDLIPLFDSKGQIFGYYYNDERNYYIYDSDKKYLNSFCLSSLGFASDYKYLRTEKKMYFFVNEEYSESVIQQGSKKTYKTRCLEVDLKNGKISIDDNVGYYVLECNNVENKNDGSYQYSYFTFKEYNEKREQSDITMCSIVTSKLSIKDSFSYDYFTQEAYVINNNSLVAKIGNTYFVVTTKERTLLSGVTQISYYSNGDVVYRKQNGLYYMCKGEDLLNDVQTNVNGFLSISKELFNGERISYLERNGDYYCGGLLLNPSYLNLLSFGIIVTNNEISVGRSKVLYFQGLKIQNISIYTEYDGYTFYQISFSDSSEVKYIKYKLEIEK